MKKQLARYFKYALLLAALTVGFKVFFPKTYAVETFKNRMNTQYWQLSTGSRIGYTLILAFGQKKPYPIIFLQGGPGGAIYDRTIEMLTPLAQDGYDVYLYDQIGSGHSDRLSHIEAYTAERHKQDLEAIVQQIGTPKIILIGQSWGALLATLFVADNLGKVEKIVLTGPGPIYPIDETWRNLAAPDSLHLKKPLYTNGQANEDAKNIRTQVVSFWAKQFGQKLASDAEMDDFQTFLTEKTNKSTVCDTAKAPKGKAGGGFYASIMTMQSLDTLQNPRPKIKNCPIPLLVMKGQCDNQKWGFTYEYLTLFPNHQLAIIPNAGHSIAVEQPELYLQTLRAFLNKK